MSKINHERPYLKYIDNLRKVIADSNKIHTTNSFCTGSKLSDESIFITYFKLFVSLLYEIRATKEPDFDEEKFIVELTSIQYELFREIFNLCIKPYIKNNQNIEKLNTIVYEVYFFQLLLSPKLYLIKEICGSTEKAKQTRYIYEKWINLIFCRRAKTSKK